MLSAVAPLQAAGFGIFEHGTKAMGMSSAFTAQADDPSAMFFNAAGIAFQHERDFMLGVTYIFSTEADFQGAAPFPGPNVSEEQEKLSAFPPHFYWVEPINDRMTFWPGHQRTVRSVNRVEGRGHFHRSICQHLRFPAGD